MKLSESQVSQEVTEIIKKYDLTDRQAHILELKLNGFQDKAICDLLSISKATLHRHYSKPNVRLALNQIKAVQLQLNTVNTTHVYEVGMNLMLQTIENNSLPIELRLTTAKAVGDIYAKVNAGDREQTLIDAVMLSQQPKPAEPMNLGFK